ncbi:MAG: NAD-dependent epimerase/dehydratase family protein [Nitrospirales bacterium]
MSRIVALTGGTGFIGQAIWHALETAGWTVRLLVRPSFLERNSALLQGKDYVVGTLEDEKSLYALVDGVKAVVHCAGRVQGGDATKFQHDNVDGVRRVVRMAADQIPIPQFLLISSLAAREPQLSLYAQSKREGEVALEEEAPSGMNWIILRPPAVYGPQDRAILPLFQWIQRGLGLQLGPSHAKFSLLYVEDLANAVRQWLGQGYHAGRAFELHDGQVNGYTWKDVFKSVTNKTVMPILVPKSLLFILALINQSMAKVLRYEPMLTYGKVRELRHHNWVCDNSDLTQAIGWVPLVSLAEGVDRTVNVPSHVS